MGELLDLFEGDWLGGSVLLGDDGAEGIGKGEGLVERGFFEEFMNKTGSEGIAGSDGVFGLDFVAGFVCICPYF